MPTITATLSLADEDLNYGDVYYTVFAVPNEAVAELLKRERNTFRVIVNINEQGAIHSGLMPDGKGNWFITVSQEVRKRFAIELADEVLLNIQPDDSDYGMPLPGEVAELWATDAEAKDLFHKLTPGKQRGLIYLIAKPKGVETRVKKAVQIHEYLKSVGGKLNSKEMNAYIKADNVNWSKY